MAEPFDWTPLLGPREHVNAERDIQSMDMTVALRRCAKGHTGSQIGPLVGFAWPSVQGAINELGKLPALARDLPCGKCGGAPMKRQRLYFASYLPLARQDVLISLAAGEPPKVALYAPRGQPRGVAPSEPALREFGPASHTRAMVMAATGVTTASQQELQAHLDETMRLWPEYPPAMVFCKD